MNEKTIKQIIENCSLFQNLDFSQLKFCNCIRTYSSNQDITNEFMNKRYIGILLEGEIHVKKIFYNDAKEIIIKSLFPSDFFGIHSLFSNNPLPYNLISQGICTVLYIPKCQIVKLLRKNNIFFNNYMKAIDKKIMFLNSKIEFFSISSAKNKVIQYLINSCNNKRNTIYIPYKKNELALFLGISRASMYRELNRLEQNELIKVNTNSIEVLNKKELGKLIS